MRRTTIAVLAVCALALAGCSSSDEEPKKETVTVTATKAPEMSAAEQRKACVDAWAETINSRPDDWDPETGEDIEPAECKGLPAGDSTDRYMEGLSKANQQNIDDFQREIDEASAAAEDGQS